MTKENVVYEEEVLEHPIYEQIRIEQKRVELLTEQNKLLKQSVEQTNAALVKIKEAILMKEDTPKWVMELFVKIQKVMDNLVEVVNKPQAEVRVENVIAKEERVLERWEFEIRDEGGNVTKTITAVEKQMEVRVNG